MSRSTVERVWEAHGLVCAVVRMDMGHRCGYVRVSDAHPWFEQGYTDAVDGRKMPRKANGRPDFQADRDFEYEDRIESHVDVHGGLTYAGKAPGDLPETGWWFGFDCAHLDDTPDTWTKHAVSSEVEQMAEQLAAVGK